MRSILFFLLSAVALSGAAQSKPASSFMVEGIKVIYKPTAKNIVDVSLYFRGGVSNYEAGKAGIEKLAVNGAVDCGNRQYNSSDFDDKKDLLGLEITASEGFDNSIIRLNCIGKYFNEGWELFTRAVTNPVFEEDAFNKMKQKMLGALRQGEGNPDSRLRTLAVQNTFAGTAYATNPDGTDSSLGALSRSDVSEYYFKTLLNKARIFIVVVGNISKEEISAKISAAFASLPTLLYQPRFPEVPVINSNASYVEGRSMATNYVYGILNAPSYTSPDLVPFILSVSLLHGILFTEIRTQRNLSYAPDARFHQLLLPYVNVYVSTTNPKACVELIASSIKELKRMDLDDKNLNQIKALYITGSYLQEEGTGPIADNLGRAETLGNWELAEQLPELVNHATGREITKAAKKYMTGIVWTYLGDPKKAEETSAAFDISVK